MEVSCMFKPIFIPIPVYAVAWYITPTKLGVTGTAGGGPCQQVEVNSQKGEQLTCP